jgi:hypothetical protein
MVWQRFAKSPRFVVCRFNSCRLRQRYLRFHFVLVRVT